ncbi:hypothetical protein JCM10207_000152 [Rhodosporidiobolus poonsookiae]
MARFCHTLAFHPALRILDVHTLGRPGDSEPPNVDLAPATFSLFLSSLPPSLRSFRLPYRLVPKERPPHPPPDPNDWTSSPPHEPRGIRGTRASGGEWTIVHETE